MHIAWAYSVYVRQQRRSGCEWWMRDFADCGTAAFIQRSAEWDALDVPGIIRNCLWKKSWLLYLRDFTSSCDLWDLPLALLLFGTNKVTNATFAMALHQPTVTKFNHRIYKDHQIYLMQCCFWWCVWMIFLKEFLSVISCQSRWTNIGLWCFAIKANGQKKK